MLTIHIKELCALRGIRYPYSWLVKNGIPVVAARTLSSGKYRHIPLEHLEKLCLIPRCTPNDLLVWQPDAGQDQTAQPLTALIRTETPAQDLIQALSTMSIEELKALSGQIKKG
ncbi:MAG: XRE family transcriptional regulator [Sphingobacteriales bacterium]|nr:MAG: XRE family transcriptional regulator [Sphingobacteriales bacterium]